MGLPNRLEEVLEENRELRDSGGRFWACKSGDLLFLNYRFE